MNKNETKTCSICGAVLPIDEFVPKSNNCKSCMKKYKKEYYQKNKEQILSKAAEYYQKNKEQRKRVAREWAANNRDKVKIRMKEYNKKTKKQRQQYRQKNKEQRKRYMERYRSENNASLKKHTKDYRKKNKQKIKEYEQNNKEKINLRHQFYRDKLFDFYVKYQLKNQLGIKSSQVSSELIQLKRAQLLLNRTLKEVKNGINSNRV